MPSVNLIAAPALSTIPSPKQFPLHLHSTPTGNFALIDGADHHEMSEYERRLMTRTTSGGYVHGPAGCTGKKALGKPDTVFEHRQRLGYQILFVYHRDGDGLNCQFLHAPAEQHGEFARAA